MSYSTPLVHRRQWKKGEWKYQRQPLRELTREQYYQVLHELTQARLPVAGADPS